MASALLRVRGQRKVSARGLPGRELLKAARESGDEARSQVAAGRSTRAQRGSRARVAHADSFEAVAPSSSNSSARRDGDVVTGEGPVGTRELLCPHIGIRGRSRRSSRQSFSPRSAGPKLAAATRPAHRAKQAAGQVFRYAIATGRAKRDPVSDLRGALAPSSHENELPSPTRGKIGRAFAGAARRIRGQTVDGVLRCNWRPSCLCDLASSGTRVGRVRPHWQAIPRGAYRARG